MTPQRVLACHELSAHVHRSLGPTHTLGVLRLARGHVRPLSHLIS